MNEKIKITKSIVFRLLLISSLLLLISFSYSDALWSKLWVIFGILELLLIVGFIVIVIYAIIWSNNEGKKYKHSKLPLLIGILTIGLLIFAPLQSSRIKLNHSINIKRKEEIVQMINDKKIKPNIGYNKNLISLPAGYKSLSITGNVNIQKVNGFNCVLFYTFSGCPDGFGGFLYLPKEISIMEYIDSSSYSINRNEFVGNNWYFIFGEQ